MPVKYLSKQTETYISVNDFSSPLSRQSLAIFDFSILHGCRRKILGDALNERKCTETTVYNLDKQSTMLEQYREVLSLVKAFIEEPVCCNKTTKFINQMETSPGIVGITISYC